MKRTIAVDIDEVLAEHNKVLVEFHNSRYGSVHTLDDYVTDHWSEIWNTDHEETARRAIEFHETGVHGKLDLVPGAQAALTRLAAMDYRLVAVTLRRKMTIDSTRLWIEKHFPGIISEVRFVHAWEDPDAPSKAEVCREIGADWLIDDTLKHCLLAADAGIDSILFGDYPWNRSADTMPKAVTRVKDWRGVLEYFEELEDIEDTIKRSDEPSYRFDKFLGDPVVLMTSTDTNGAEGGFRERVEAIVRQIPCGRVMTYGQLAALAGSPTAARIVGGIAHFGDPDLPWQRVVNKQGGLASGYPGGRHGHAAALRAESLVVSAVETVDVGKLLWWPPDLDLGLGSDQTGQS